MSRESQMVLGAVAWAANNPIGTLALYLGMRHAPALTMDLGYAYIKNSVKYMGANIRDTAKVASKYMRSAPRRGVPRGALTFRGPRIGGALTVLLFAPDIYVAYQNPGAMMQPGGVYGSEHTGGWFYGFHVESPN